jgi:FAD/FMN-containing dehydrogenase
MTNAASWRNWAGNQHSSPDRLIPVFTEDEVRECVVEARRTRTTVRAMGSGHSFTPVVDTRGTLVDMHGLSGVIDADRAARRATVWAGTRLSDVGAPLWRAGLSIANQGDYDAQTIAGLTATGTKGSGTAFGSISSTIRGMRLVTGTGDVLDIDESRPDLLHAARVSLGLLGVVTRLTLDVVPAYRIRESNAVMSVDELLDNWDSALASYRHFSFWWMPTDTSHRLYGLPPVPAGHAYVKMLQEEPHSSSGDDAPVAGDVGSRVGRAHLVYPDVSCDDEATFDELEYMVPATDAREAFGAIRTLMRERFPDEQSPVQIRWQKGDDAYLSGQYHRDSTSVSVSGYLGRDYEPFLRAVDEELQQFDARPHWGKQHFLTAARVRSLYPALDRFLAVREELDPDGLFLNDHFREMFGL